MTLKDFIKYLSSEMDKKTSEMEVKFNTKGKSDMEFLSIYKFDGKLQIDIGYEGE